MPGKKSNLVCPSCKSAGGFIHKRWVKRIVNIPKADRATINIPNAWDYAAKVFLRIREQMILFPPSSSNDVYTQGYGIFPKLKLHNAEQIKDFESRHLSTISKNVNKKKAQLTPPQSVIGRPIEKTAEYDYRDNNQLKEDDIIMHIKLLDEAGRITKSSISWLYASIVCLVLRDISTALSLPQEVEKEYAYAIYTYFSVFEIDLRRRRTWYRWAHISEDVRNHGYHAAASMNRVVFNNLCLNCNNIKMEKSKQSKTGWICPRCASTNVREIKESKLTARHIRNKHKSGKISQKAIDFINYQSLFDKLMDCYYSFGINNNPELKEDFLEHFQEYETQVSNDLLAKRETYFIGHYDASKKWKKRWCHIPEGQLSSVEINDDKYFSQYKPLINELYANASKGPDDNSSGQGLLLPALFLQAGDILKELGWPEHLIDDKIFADMKYCSDTNYHLRPNSS